jgi:predicted transcriptional regulator of viral defense system
VISLEVKNLKIIGAKECFYSPAYLINVQQRCINTRLSLSLLREISRNASIIASAEVELNRAKLLLASYTKKDRLERVSSGYFSVLFAWVISLSNDEDSTNLSYNLTAV